VNDVLVLCYHAVSERWDADLAVHPDALAAQLEALVRRGYRGATFTEAITNPARGRILAVTFDDAFRSVLERAEPILGRLGLPATVFVPTAFADSGLPLRWPGIDHWMGSVHEGELRPLSWDELAGLAASGWEVGSHTHSHPRLTALDDRALAQELTGSRQSCEQRLGRPCASIAYPYGDVDDRVARAAQVAGYIAGGALPAGRFVGGELQWPRVGIYHSDTQRRFELKVGLLGRWLRRWPGVDAALGAVRRVV
jgi:peptidoglycan/xylan/chitin deacetylase (PgdA/CDA1 family)